MFGFSMVIGIAAMISSESIESRHQLMNRIFFILVWLLSVSEGLLECLFDSGSSEGIVRLACTIAVVGMTIEKTQTEDSSTSTGTGQKIAYGSIQV